MGHKQTGRGRPKKQLPCYRCSQISIFTKYLPFNLFDALILADSKFKFVYPFQIRSVSYCDYYKKIYILHCNPDLNQARPGYIINKLCTLLPSLALFSTSQPVTLATTRQAHMNFNSNLSPSSAQFSCFAQVSTSLFHAFYHIHGTKPYHILCFYKILIGKVSIILLKVI